MGLLRILGLARIEARLFRKIAVAEAGADLRARRIDGFTGHLYAVGSHIGDETHGLAADVDTLIELLRHLHGA